MIRTAEPTDSPAIAQLLDQLGYPTTEAEVPERLRRIRSEGRGEVFVSVVAGEVGGLVSVQVGPGLTRSEDTAYVSTLVVAEGIRGKGVGRELLEIAEGYARKHDCPRIVVATANHRKGAHAFYERLGWEWTGRRYAKVLA
ncbi:MAG TPA: GNAT family N-acetyltransferase [Gemmatimonadales bacterium]|nr:GNAT family N-acetyltransferase [Gemmatimonadales bacterium]